eukprot:502188-Alexandrium_andersonii.AAC.1
MLSKRTASPCPRWHRPAIRRSTVQDVLLPRRAALRRLHSQAAHPTTARPAARHHIASAIGWKKLRH